MTIGPNIDRRVFIRDLGKAGAAFVVLGGLAAACSSGDEAGVTVLTTDGPDADADAPDASTAATTQPATSSPETETSAGSTDSAWERVNLGFVSAYVLVRGGEAVIVDTGVGGSEGAIEESLTALGSGWSDVGHVIATHHHGDHVGSLNPVMEAALEAAGYIGEADLGQVSPPRPLTGLVDGDQVFDLEIVGTPGHTPGHISILDPLAGVLLAGDAINGADGGGVTGPNAQFTPDMDTAIQSAVKLGTLEYDAVLFGHGEPVLSGASVAVAEMAANL